MRPNTDTTRAGSKTAKNTDVPVTMEILPRSLLDKSKQNATTKDTMILWLDFWSLIGPKINDKDNNSSEKVMNGWRIFFQYSSDNDLFLKPSFDVLISRLRSDKERYFGSSTVLIPCNPLLIDIFSEGLLKILSLIVFVDGLDKIQLSFSATAVSDFIKFNGLKFLSCWINLMFFKNFSSWWLNKKKGWGIFPWKRNTESYCM